MRIRAAMIGLGSVNRSLLRILVDKRVRLAQQYGLKFDIVCVADSSGAAVNEDGFDPFKVDAHKQRGRPVADLADGAVHMPLLQALDTTQLDLVFEASPVDLKTGGVGLVTCRQMLARGVPVVLANKAPLVLAFSELTELADQHGAAMKYSATVCGGLPILNIGRRDLIAGDILELHGIFNATSNFILDSMANGESYDAALAEAQARGIAEADPSLDVGGWDTANKLLIIVNTITGAGIGLDDISVAGIADIDTAFVVEERKKGNALKLVGSAKDGTYDVRPMSLPQSAFLAQCTGWEMAVEIHTDIYGIGYYKLWEREPVPTAASMLRDAVHIFT